MASERVPPEFTGMARAFRARIMESDLALQPAMSEIAAYANEIIQRRRTYRPEHFAGIERQWRLTIPETGRIGYATERTKDSLTIADIRLFSSCFRRLSWHDDAYENSLSMMIYSGRFMPGQANIKSLPLSAISLHALARRYQRSFDNADIAVFRDLSYIALNVKGLLGLPSFRQPAGNGAWLGDTVLATYHDIEQRILATRTFI
jgi:hypothetical protein